MTLISSSSRGVTFQHAFVLGGMAKPLPRGTYTLRVEQGPLDLMWEAYHTKMMLVVVLPRGEEQWPITETELEALLAADRQQSVPTGHSRRRSIYQRMGRRSLMAMMRSVSLAER